MRPPSQAVQHNSGSAAVSGCRFMTSTVSDKRCADHRLNPFRGGLPVIGLIAWTSLLIFALPAWADDEHRVQFHAQGGSLDNLNKDDLEVVFVSMHPVTKAEGLSLLDRLSEKLATLKTNSKVVIADVEDAEGLIPTVKDWINSMGPGGLKRGSGRTMVAEKGKIRIDCEPFKGYYFVRDFPHSFVITASAWDKTESQSWRADACPGRKLGRDQFNELKSKMFKSWDIDPEKANELKVRTALAAWKDAREWFENEVLREGKGMIEGDSKDKTIDKEDSDGEQRTTITFNIEVKMLTGIGFIEED